MGAIGFAVDDKFGEDDGMVGHLAHVTGPKLDGGDSGGVDHKFLSCFVESGSSLYALHEGTMAKLSLCIATSHLKGFHERLPLGCLLVVTNIDARRDEHSVCESKG